MNAKKIKALRQLVRTCVNVHHIAKVAQEKADSLGATPKQISRAFDVVLKVRSPVIRHGLSEDIKAFLEA